MMDNNFWEEIEESIETKNTWLTVRDPEGSWSAKVKWDGCIDLRCRFNLHTEPNMPLDEDYLHICDIDDLIERLKALRQMAYDHFEIWPG